MGKLDKNGKLELYREPSDIHYERLLKRVKEDHASALTTIKDACDKKIQEMVDLRLGELVRYHHWQDLHLQAQKADCKDLKS